jgi:hypothetical protein
VTVTQLHGRTFDWRARFDPRSLAYRAAPRQTDMPSTGVIWQHGPVLDQGREGACVGMGCAGAVAASPSGRTGVDLPYALSWYRRAQRLDVWPGEAYEGTSVLAGCLVGRERRLWSGFRWAKNPAELAAGIIALGPAILGVAWSEQLYETDPTGVMRTDELADDLGHCVLATGYLPEPDLLPEDVWTVLEELDLADGVHGLDTPSLVILNSWGHGYGRNGLALAPLPLVRRWFARRGEFALPENRTPRKGQTMAERIREDDSLDELEDENPDPEEAPAVPEPAPEQTTEEDPADRTLRPTAAELVDGDRITDGLPPELGQDSATVRSTQHVTAWGGQRVRVTTTAGTFSCRASDRFRVRRPS